MPCARTLSSLTHRSCPRRGAIGGWLIDLAWSITSWMRWRCSLDRLEPQHDEVELPADPLHLPGWLLDVHSSLLL